jgi:hypothetical protein
MYLSVIFSIRSACHQALLPSGLYVLALLVIISRSACGGGDLRGEVQNALVLRCHDDQCGMMGFGGGGARRQCGERAVEKHTQVLAEHCLAHDRLRLRTIRGACQARTATAHVAIQLSHQGSTHTA